MKTLNRSDHTVDTILSERQFEEVSDCLSALAEKLRVTAVLLVTSGGRIVAQKVGGGWKGNPTLLSTLAASSYAAAKEMAKILEETENFQMVLHEGEKRSVFVSSVDGDFFVIVVFESGVALGMVRLFTKRTVAQLLAVLSRREEAVKMGQVFDRKFQSLLGEELDRSFRETF